MIKKSKFAAIALSVVMAVSVMPSAVLAAETEVTDENAAYRVDEDSITFTYANGVCTVKYKEVRVNNEADYEWKERTADLNYVVAPTCEEEGYDVYTIEIDGKIYNSSNKLNVKKALGHDMQEVNRVVDNVASCEEGGTAHVNRKCSRCDYTDTVDVTLNPTGHDWAKNPTYEALENILLDDNGEIIFDEDGVPMLENPKNDGLYATYTDCNACDETKDYKEHVILAKEVAFGQVVKTDKIVENDALYTGMDFYGPVEESLIELANCNKAGSYVVRFYTEDGTRIINEKTYTVAPHHFNIQYGVEFDTEDEANQCTVVKNEDGTFTVIDHSCYLEIPYYVVGHCSAKGCPNKPCDTEKYYGCSYEDLKEVSREKKTAEPTGHHNINTDAQKAIAAASARGITYEALVEMVKSKKYDYVTVKGDTSTCTEDGTATIEYTCKICKQVVETETVKVVAKGHDPLPPVAENLVPPTCTEKGHYDANVYCNRCGELLRTRYVEIGLDKHSNDKEDGDKFAQVEFVGEVVVDMESTIYNEFVAGNPNLSDIYDEVAANVASSYGPEYTVVGQTYTLCQVCGGNKEILGDAVVTVDNVFRPSKNQPTCIPGSITLTISYKKADDTVVSKTATFKYYSTINEYRGRTAHTPDKIVKENVVDATCTAEGSYEEVILCSVCGEELGRTTKTIEKAAHTAGEAVVENEVAATCAAEGSYDEVVYCTVCGEEMSRETKAIEKAAHTAGEAVVENEVAATCAAEGSYDEVVYCTVCGEEMSRETKTVEKIAHTAGEAVIENEVAATGTTEGSYDEVVYCTVCGEEMSRETKTVEKLAALPAVKNLKAVTTGMKRVKLTWDAVDGATGYLIIGLNGTRTGSQIAYTARTEWTDFDADANDYNYYWVIAYDAENKVKGELGDYTWALGRVVGKVFKVEAVATEGGIELDWDNVVGANAYVILSKTGSNDADFNAPVCVESSEYAETGLAAGTVKFFWVYGIYNNEDGKTLAAGKTSPFAWAQAE